MTRLPATDLPQAAALSWQFSQAKRRAFARLFPDSLKFGILYEIDVVLVLLGHFIVVKREAFRNPADQEPETAKKYEELQDSVNKGIGFSGFTDPFRIQVVGTFVDPLAYRIT